VYTLRGAIFGQGSSDDPEQVTRAGVHVGVSGCGKRAVYVLSMGSGWVLNSDAQPERR
jgi:hypothetical protein